MALVSFGLGVFANVCRDSRCHWLDKFMLEKSEWNDSSPNATVRFDEGCWLGWVSQLSCFLMCVHAWSRVISLDLWVLGFSATRHHTKLSRARLTRTPQDLFVTGPFDGH